MLSWYVHWQTVLCCCSHNKLELELLPSSCWKCHWEHYSCWKYRNFFRPFWNLAYCEVTVTLTFNLWPSIASFMSLRGLFDDVPSGCSSGTGRNTCWKLELLWHQKHKLYLVLFTISLFPCCVSFCSGNETCDRTWLNKCLSRIL